MKIKFWIPVATVAGVVGVVFYLGAISTFTPSAQPIGYVPQVAIDAYDISDDARIAWKVDYDRANWSGDIEAIRVRYDGTIENQAPNWDRTVLEDQDYSTGRIIFTRNGSNGVPFRYAAAPSASTLSAAQQTSIASTAAAQQSLINYIRGDKSNEKPSGAAYRARTTPLGAIIHSTPLYFTDGTSHRVYVGANDGMLHAFNAYTGVEEFAYIPSFLIGNLKSLAVTTDPYPLTYFVDGNQAISREIVISGSQSNVLVGGVGAGGKGLYALNITSPDPASESEASSMSLWEITSSTAGFTNLGYTYGTPVFGKLNSGEMAVFVGNGYASSSGAASLFAINPATGALIKELVTSDSTGNGLSSPTLVDVDKDGDVDYAYAGDLNGKLWKFDLTNATTASWPSPTLIFTTSPAQSITMAPAVEPHIKGGQMVVFATGRMLMPTDLTDTATHYAYGIWDGAPAANAAILTQTLTAASYASCVGCTSIPVRTASLNLPNWNSGAANHKGWKVALPVGGERVVGDGAFINDGGIFMFTSTNPTVTNSIPPNGATWLNEISYMTGGSPNTPIFNLNNDALIDDGDRIKDADGNPISTVAGVVVSKYLRSGLASQPVLVKQSALLDNTLIQYNPDAVPIDLPDDRGVSGGHFDADIYYGAGGTGTSSTVNTPTANAQTKSVCVTESTIKATYPGVNTNVCKTTNGFSSGYGYVTKYVSSASQSGCSGGGKKKWDVTCNTYTSATTTTPAWMNPLNKKHFHEYDDIFNVTGVNMLNASSTTLNISNAITSTSTEFKVLMYNQYWSPATQFSVGGGSFVNIKNYGGLTATSSLDLSTFPTYTRANVSTLMVKWPLDAFASKDWWNDGDPRAGLVPTQTGCVNKESSAPGLYNAPHNGALTVQLIKPTTPASALVMNIPDKPEWGWRVRRGDGADAGTVDDRSEYVLAEWTYFWHHPNGACTNDSDWMDSPEQDLSPSDPKKYQTPAAGSADPNEGDFSGGGSVVSDVTVGDTRTVTYSDGSTKVIVTTDNGDGTITVAITTCGPGGTGCTTETQTNSNPGSSIGTGGEQAGLQYGRISWRELSQ